ncbi:TetR/AcrR family transcriptional regulator, partial [Mesonia sp.]|uniref:TetR/AcrR family transcriptional regulator n=1 Tax=Mesonia sp. TaxID=1960830 RepID=UPI0017534BDE
MNNTQPKEKLSKREHILKEAAKLFVEKGYKATSMKDIASVIGVEAASLYNHIKSKQEILVVLLGGLADRFSIGIHEINESKSASKEKLEL